jgi:leucyl/phenylalanyl-tRNA--protein transferase
VHEAWGSDSPAPGLLCAGNDLTVATLYKAYSNGIFPWYSLGQPPLWWCPDPRMTLDVFNFRIHPSLRKTLRKFSRSNNCKIFVDSQFEQVIRACSTASRGGESGTWILPEMIQAYIKLNEAGFAHSVETWVDGQLVGGLYFVAIAHAVFGESMFHHQTDGSKIALSALVAMCRHHQIPRIDCQQNTRHLSTLGASEISRSRFISGIDNLITKPAIDWKFSNVYWQELDPLAKPTT